MLCSSTYSLCSWVGYSSNLSLIELGYSSTDVASSDQRGCCMYNSSTKMLLLLFEQCCMYNLKIQAKKFISLYFFRKTVASCLRNYAQIHNKDPKRTARRNDKERRQQQRCEEINEEQIILSLSKLDLDNRKEEIICEKRNTKYI